jgi:hypothetical protein
MKKVGDGRQPCVKKMRRVAGHHALRVRYEACMPGAGTTSPGLQHSALMYVEVDHHNHLRTWLDHRLRPAHGPPSAATTLKGDLPRAPRYHHVVDCGSESNSGHKKQAAERR